MNVIRIHTGLESAPGDPLRCKIVKGDIAPPKTNMEPENDGF